MEERIEDGRVAKLRWGGVANRQRERRRGREEKGERGSNLALPLPSCAALHHERLRFDPRGMLSASSP